MYSESELAYLAGIIDGEGCISIHKWRDKGKYYGYSLELSVANSDKDLTEWLHAKFGGVIVTYEFKNPNHKPRHCWRIHHGKALAIIELALPYLIIKRRQALLACDFRETFRNGNTLGLSREITGKRETLIKLLHEYNRKGRQKYPDAPVLDKEDILVFQG